MTETPMVTSQAIRATAQALATLFPEHGAVKEARLEHWARRLRGNTLADLLAALEEAAKYLESSGEAWPDMASLASLFREGHIEELEARRLPKICRTSCKELLELTQSVEGIARATLGQMAGQLAKEAGEHLPEAFYTLRAPLLRALLNIRDAEAVPEREDIAVIKTMRRALESVNTDYLPAPEWYEALTSHLHDLERAAESFAKHSGKAPHRQR